MMYELIPTNGRKSFYGKAKVMIDNDGSETLYSFDTPIIKRVNNTLIPLYTRRKYRTTTASHVKTFCGLNKTDYKKLLAQYGKELEE